MNNDTNTTPIFASHADRLAYYSQAKVELVPPTAPSTRRPPRPRRTSVRHRAIR